MPKLRVSDIEYYNLRKRNNDNGTYFLLSPYSCMNPISLYFDQIRKEVSIYLRNRLLYKGMTDLSRIKEELENLNKLNEVEIVTLLTILNCEPETRGYVTGRRSPIDKLTFALAYESAEEVRRRIDEVMKNVDPERLLYALDEILNNLPPSLREPMMEKLRPYLRKKEKQLQEPVLVKKKKVKKKKKEMAYVQ